MSCTEWDFCGDGRDSMEREVAQYFATGESDPLGTAFPGNDTFERMTKYDQPHLTCR